MEDYVCCDHEMLEDGVILLENVALPEGLFSLIYLGHGGVCAIVAEDSSLKRLYSALRELIGSVRVSLYVGKNGRYNPLEDSVEAVFGGQDTRDHEILAYLHQVPDYHTFQRLLRMRDKLIAMDAQTRGHYIDADGTLYLLHHGVFQRTSELDPERQYFLTLLGGFLGLHRFVMGKYFTGLFYLFTCGGFLAGWLMDLLQLYWGTQRDRDKALILPLRQCWRKWFLLLPGLMLGVVALVLYAMFYGAILDVGAPLEQDTLVSISDFLIRCFPLISAN